MGKEVDRQKYLRNCATTLRGQLGLDAEQFKDCKNFAEIIAALSRHQVAGAIYSRLGSAPDEQIGKLACSKDETQVRNLATDAVIPAIAEKIWAELNPKRVLKCRYCDFIVPKFAHRRPGTGFDFMRDHIDTAHPEEAKKLADAIYGSREARDEADDEDYADSVKQ
jgi:hypothetical protein